MVTQQEFRDSDYAVDWRRTAYFTNDKEYDVGVITSPNGLVEYYAQGSKQNLPCTQLRFCFEGRVFSRSWKRRFSPRTMVTLAKQFVADVVNAD